MWTCEIAESSQTHVVKAGDKGKNVVQENQPQQQLASVASLSVQQLQNMIANSIRAYNLMERATESSTSSISSKHARMKDQEETNLSARKGVSQPLLKHQMNLSTRAHDMELSIASIETKDFPVPEVKKDKKETKGAEKIVKSTMKESMVINTTSLKFFKRKEERAEKKDDGSERQCCRYADMFTYFLIQILQTCRATTGEVTDPTARIHPVEKYFVLKELILRLASEKKIELDMNEEVAPEDPQGKERPIEEDDGARFFCDHQYENPEVIACHAISATAEESISPRSVEEEGVLKDLPRFNVDDLLSLPQETKTILIDALLNSGASSLSAPTVTYESTPYFMFIDFSDKDLLLGSKLHNRPLYVSRYVGEQRVDKILIDNGSTINIMLKSIMRQLGILMDELSNSKLVI
ncbi:ty3-gypsy retrotransposon protein [Cucumis melo var. makuwa]|uniref:Ty3-gypsy retrotransposon protein n=1 Tax=Cucumis melo var. makuwa TaxID=1194695 RepID=A0A5D3CRS8_CUCMM|nr:ty3-gypsy retrotransposon protein [Cucumis melo var. makuwa]